MGWCSGTSIFDAVAKYVLRQSTADDKHKEEVLTVLIEALQNEDWDCEQDSYYVDDPLVTKIYLNLGILEESDLEP